MKEETNQLGIVMGTLAVMIIIITLATTLMDGWKEYLDHKYPKPTQTVRLVENE